MLNDHTHFIVLFHNNFMTHMYLHLYMSDFTKQPSNMLLGQNDMYKFIINDDAICT